MNGNYEKSIKLIESHIFDDYGDYTGDNIEKSCYYLNYGEFAQPTIDEELFSNLDNDECIVVSINDGNRFAFKGNYNSINILAFLTEYSFLDNSDIYIFSKNNLNYNELNAQLGKLSVNSNIIFNDYSNEKEDISIDMLEGVIKVSKGHGDVQSIDIGLKKEKTI